MPSYGFIANLPGPRRGIFPVRDPVGGMRRPHGPVTAAAYIPSNLPIIRPGPGWHIGPSVYSNLPVGTVYGAATEDAGFVEARSAAVESLVVGVGGGLAGAALVYGTATKVLGLSDKTAGSLSTAVMVVGGGYSLWSMYNILRSRAGAM